MPQALGGSLFDLAMDPGRRHPVAIAKIFYRALKALSLLHSLHILHGDVKPGNILLKTRDSEDPRPYIIDFGHSRNLSLCDVCTCKLMTCHYGSPEVLALAEHSFPSDVWSTALSFHFVITGIESINGSDLSAMAKQAANLRLSFDHPNWSQYPTSIQSLLLAMTNKDPGRRPTMAACMGDRFFIEFLGEDWITLEDEAVKLPGSEEMRELLLRVKEAAMEEEDDTIH
jgi:serine/threonine protein kinase